MTTRKPDGYDSFANFLLLISMLLAGWVTWESISPKEKTKPAENKVVEQFQEELSRQLTEDKFSDLQQQIDDTRAEFQQAQAQALTAYQASTAEFSATLKTIQAKLLELDAFKTQPAPVKETKPVVKTEPVPLVVATPTPVVTKVVAKVRPVRMRGPAWNVSGNWNYSITELASHLSLHHNVDTSGYSIEDLKIMHDNLHNGYPAMGSALNSTLNPTGTMNYYYSIPQRTRWMQDCPTGTCPPR